MQYPDTIWMTKSLEPPLFSNAKLPMNLIALPELTSTAGRASDLLNETPPPVKVMLSALWMNQPQAGTHRAVATRNVDLHVGEGLVADVVAGVRAPDRRAELRAALAGDGDVVVGDVADVPDARMVTAPFTGTDLLHDRRRHVGDVDVAVVHVGDVGAVHGHHAEAGLVRPGDGDRVEVVVGE